MTFPIPSPCAHMLMPGTQEEPPEYCDEDAEPGSEFCADHQEYDDSDDHHDHAALTWGDEHDPTL